MFKYIFTLLFISTCLNAQISLEDINSKPPSRAKNFMIWQYLNQDISAKQADKAYAQIKGESNKLFFAYAKKTNNKKVKYKATCMKQKNLLSIKDRKCLIYAFSPKKTFSLSNKQRKKLLKKIKSKKNRKLLKIQSEPHTLKAYKKYDADTFLTFFNGVSKTYRKNHLNIFLDKEFVNKLSPSWKISRFISLIINDSNLDKLQLSLLRLDGKKLNAQNNFFLALNQLKHSRKKEALKFLKLSRKKSKSALNVDKNNFWMYKITLNKKYLKKLVSSKDINIYTIFAHEKLNKNFDNYFSAVETIDKKTHKDLSDPFYWNKVLKEIKQTPKDKLFDLAKKYSHQNMIPVQAFILEKAYRYKIHGYMMPYNIYLKDLNKDDKALVYAIMRQESNLIPSSLSYSYALGLMQIMPFVVDAISKNISNPIDEYDDMFVPQNNIRYALAHLKWMKKHLHHPLFMAYAYNGGMGFLKRHLQTGTFKKGKYEPYMSMELMSNTQSREYGKKVLANYVMYNKIMGEKVSIINLFDTLTQPKKTDNFREQG